MTAWMARGDLACGAALLAGAILLAGCGSEGGTGSLDGTISGDNGFPKSDIIVADPGQPGETVEEDAAPDTEPDLFVPEPGAFGYPCNDNEDCDSGWCIVTARGRVCTKLCEEACPEGWTCRQKVQADPVFMCLPRWLNLCDPCETTSDCSASETDTGHFCVERGAEGSFCGGECGSDGKCPKGYSCIDVEVGSGTMKPQCMPDSGTCRCSPLAMELQLATTCVIENEHGACAGARECSEDGLTACDAKVPAAETCNGQDDDCDGATDDLDDDSCEKTNEYGTCPGTQSCIGGVPFCDAPAAAPEKCDGFDNDCDGLFDEGFLDTDKDLVADCLDDDDDNDGLADAADNCPLKANEGQEDADGDLSGDACDPDDDNDGVLDNADCEPFDKKIYPGAMELCDDVDNNCNGATDEDLCDDGNPCTEDSCNPDGSCAFAPKNGQPCDDGSVCSEVDVCVDGQCTGTSLLDCSDGDPCTADQCDEVTGCSNPPVAGEPEKCDGVDNNCNGQTDEGFVDTDGDLTKDCVDDDDDNDGFADDTDNCPLIYNPAQDDNEDDGKGDICDPDDDNDGVGDAQDCDPLNGAIYTGAAEVCDFLDNNCNGQTDEGLCDDGNPCTKDSCGAGGACIHQNDNTALCDDGTVCTQVDKCVDGVCTGFNQLICEDGNPCTDNSCDPVIGCLSLFNQATCDDGNLCTENDKCSNGYCSPGTPKSCDDGNPCTQTWCNPGSGCLSQPVDNIGCTPAGGAQQCQKGTCQGGQCVLSPASDGLACDYGSHVPQCKTATCQGGQCLLSSSPASTSCTTGSAECPQGYCASGSCLVVDGQSCDYDPALCEADVPGRCTASGSCEPQADPTCTCDNCGGICFCCVLPFPLPKLPICFE